MNKILIIGCGHMGSALLKSWELNTDFSFIVVDPFQKNNIKKKFSKKTTVFKNISEVKNLNLIDLVIFAIKPQIATSVLRDISNYKFRKKTIFISVIAGKTIKYFREFLPKSNPFVRVMPNMPSMIKEGMTCMFASENVSNKNKKIVNLLFSHVGLTLWLKKEYDINKVTAISGSGPGYIFMIIDAFEKAALKLGLGEKETKKLIHQTFLGSILLLLNEKIPASKLADNIAIKGGTTEAGLKQFKNQKILHKSFDKVIKAAYNKSLQLGKRKK
tara:strand:+ start:4027 stop:4845 length:819 start_codon:yes stop_codon:yes gene_type:complete